METTERRRNPRGQGSLLRGELIAAAARLIEETGDPSSVTLRAVAREAGIAPPSIYRHFTTPVEIASAALTESLTQFAAVLTAAMDGIDLARDRLMVRSQAYVAFVREQPRRHRLLFERPADIAARLTIDPDLVASCGAAFEQFIEVVRAAQKEAGHEGTTAAVDATLLWSALFGYVLLQGGNPTLPWPPDDRAAIQQMVYSLCRLG